MTAADRLAGRQEVIFAERDRKLATARARRARRRHDANQQRTGEEASRRVQRGDNERPLVSVNANKTPAELTVNER